jgi:hypothetical protein
MVQTCQNCYCYNSVTCKKYPNTPKARITNATICDDITLIPVCKDCAKFVQEQPNGSGKCSDPESALWDYLTPCAFHQCGFSAALQHFEPLKKEQMLTLNCFWRKVHSEYKPNWICLNEKLNGWNSGSIGEELDELLFENSDLLFDTAYKVKLTITLELLPAKQEGKENDERE